MQLATAAINSYLPTVTQTAKSTYCLCTVQSATAAINSYLPTATQKARTIYCVCTVQLATAVINSYIPTFTQTANCTPQVQFWCHYCMVISICFVLLALLCDGSVGAAGESTALQTGSSRFLSGWCNLNVPFT
jgi:hypothetical protein